MPQLSPPRERGSWSVLLLLVLSQVLGVSVWFASSAVLPSLTAEWGLRPSDGGLLITAVQLGFIAGTLGFALTNLADLFPPSRVFLGSALLGAGVNLPFATTASGLAEALVYRFITGVAMAGIYPVGMKIIVSYFPSGLGNAMGWLLGAVSLGAAVPFLLAFLGSALPWQAVIAGASVLVLLSGLIVATLGEGPHLPPATRLEWRMMFRVFRYPAYRASALGYFGHCWEIPTLWVIAPLLAKEALGEQGWAVEPWGNLAVFLIIAGGGLGCVAGGLMTGRLGSLRVAALALAGSALFCVAAPWLARLPAWGFLPLLGLWSVFAVADSPQFSAMSSRACPPAYVGTALTIQNSIGFAITALSIEVCFRAWELLGSYVGWLLAPGPLLGLFFLLRERGKREGVNY